MPQDESLFLHDLIEDVLWESGQFMTGDLSCIGVDKKRFFNTIVLGELAIYERYRPLTFQFNRISEQRGNGQSTVFFSFEDSTGVHDGSSDAANVFDFRVGVCNRDPGMVPKWISEVVPAAGYGSRGDLQILFGGIGIGYGVGGTGNELRSVERSILHEPYPFIWHYEHDSHHGILYTGYTGSMDITAHYGYPVIEMIDSNGILIDAEFKYMDSGKDEAFIDMIIGRFLISLGRSRRAFTLASSPINFDGAELVAEGTEKYKEARDLLHETSNWWSAIGT